MKYINLFCILILFFIPGFALAQQAANSKKLVVEVDWIPEANAEVFVVGGQKFGTIDALKTFLDKQAAGTTVVWDPGCVRIGNNPLLSSEKEKTELRNYLEKRSIKLVIMPTG
jgi:hypothetical protein